MSLENIEVKSKESVHHKFMKKALAQEAYDQLEVPVGCVIVLNNEVIELEAIDQILYTTNYTSDIFQQCTLYVTVEPCVMCAYAIRILRIKHVYYGCSNERFGGTGSVFNIHNDTKLTLHPAYLCEGGYYREESIMLLRKFYVRENKNAPEPRRKHQRILKTEIKPSNK
ncbi:4738_t:CDS:2 [Entrophospora sp. SA101]|nr:6842_t:CDS:2 [Entrophospora sp. SA101]CAJ0901463.1 4738_t:CDS:2 [Entrophospora sp. SA101]